ncbi:MAG TPA: hypothetical protein VGN88_00580 [Phycisphaerae bacterium]|jgi:ABC-type amino acid transport substrate-binding protein
MKRSTCLTFFLLAAIIVAFLLAMAARAAFSPAPSPAVMAAPSSAMTYIYDAPESALDTRYAYHWKILTAALEETKAKWGPYVVQAAAERMTENRQSAELKNATGKLTIMYLGTTEDFEKNLIPIRIPVDRNLGGYMVMLIRKEDQPKFSAIESIEDLRKFKIGLGQGWIDVGILQSNHFDVVTGSYYEGLFEMLANKRFDAFSRAAVEILDEFNNASRKSTMASLQIEKSFILYYPLPMYFWFSKTPDGQRLADRVREGMLAMYDDGTYMKLFKETQQHKIDQLHLNRASRRFFQIDNPNLRNLNVPFQDKRLWFDIDKGE